MRTRNVLVAMATVAATLTASGLAWSAGASTALEATGPSATIGDVVCIDRDGTIAVTLVAGDDATGFIVFTDGTADDTDEVTVPAGSSQVLTLTGLSDDDHLIDVEVSSDNGEPVDSLAEATKTPDCDAVPVGPYTNAKGTMDDGCYGSDVEVRASNKPIGGNVTDLQPATFTLTFAAFVDQPTDDATADPTDGGDEDPPTIAPVTLDSFVLDDTTRTYERTFTFADIGAAGILTLSAGGTVLAKDYYFECPSAATAGSSGPGLPNAGA
jgi:hypothetical protein